jgi:hypothetical protein
MGYCRYISVLQIIFKMSPSRFMEHIIVHFSIVARLIDLQWIGLIAAINCTCILDSYASARQKIPLAELTSDLNTDDDRSSPARRHRRFDWQFFLLFLM